MDPSGPHLPSPSSMTPPSVVNSSGGGSGVGYLSPMSNPNPSVTVANDSVLSSIGGGGPPSHHSGVITSTGAVSSTSSIIQMSQQQSAMIMNQSSHVGTPPPHPVPHVSPGGTVQVNSGPVPMDVDIVSNGINMNSHQQQQSLHSSGGSDTSSPATLNGNALTAAATAANPNMSDAEKNALMVVLSFLKKHNLKTTEESLKKEAKIADSDIKGPLPMDSDVQTVLSSYASDENPDEYTDAYTQLKNFIDTSLDAYKFEVGQVLWPVFVHMYLELVYNEHEAQGQSFFKRFSKMQESFYEEDTISLGAIQKKEQLLNSENPFRSLTTGLYSSGHSSVAPSGLYVVRMSREAQSILKRFLQEKRLKLVQNIVQDRIHIEVYDGIPRGKAAIHAVAGHIMGEALKQDNKAKVYYGLLREPDLQNVQMDEDDEDGSTATIAPSTSSTSGGGSSGGASGSGSGGGGATGDSPTPGSSSQKGSSSSSKGGGGDGGGSDTANGKTEPQSGGGSGQGGSAATPGGEKSGSSSKKKKSKKEWLLSKKGKNDPNAPPLTRMPLPEVRDVDKIEKAKALRESARRVTLGPEKLPSCCFYTVLNGDNQVTYVKWSEDGSLMAIGFASSLIKVWTMTPTKLRKIKSATELQDIDREADDVLVRMMDDSSAEQFRCLRGHSGPVYSLDFSPDKAALLSSSDDCSIRLWSLLTWTCIVVYKGHLFPVWKAVFSPHGGYYFASAGYDCTARLWATDSYNALRVFAGHYSDVTAVLFHPNSNYVATGSADRSVRLWDCVSGSCVRLMTGHKGKVHALCFSIDGRFLVSSASDSKILVWDLANGGLLTCLNLHKSTVYSLAFSREGSVLGTGGLDYCIRMWDFLKMVEDVVTEDGGGAVIPPDVKRISGDGMLIGEFYTKATPIYSLHFTRRNILLATGPFA